MAVQCEDWPRRLDLHLCHWHHCCLSPDCQDPDERLDAGVSRWKVHTAHREISLSNSKKQGSELCVPHGLLLDKYEHKLGVSPVKSAHRLGSRDMFAMFMFGGGWYFVLFLRLLFFFKLFIYLFGGFCPWAWLREKSIKKHQCFHLLWKSLWKFLMRFAYILKGEKFIVIAPTHAFSSFKLNKWILILLYTKPTHLIPGTPDGLWDCLE